MHAQVRTMKGRTMALIVIAIIVLPLIVPTENVLIPPRPAVTGPAPG